MRLATLALCFVPAFLACASTAEAPRVPVVATPSAPRVVGEPALHATTILIVNGTEERFAVYLSPVSRVRIATVEPHGKACVPVVRTSESLVLVAVPQADGPRIYSPHFQASAPGWRWTIRTRLMERADDLWALTQPCANRRA